MTKLVNLDQLNVTSQRRILWKDAHYDVKDFNVREFIAFQALQSEFVKAYSDDNLGDLLAAAEKITKLAVPSFPIEDLGEMNPVQLLSIQALIANLWPDEVSEVVEGQEEGKAQAE